MRSELALYGLFDISLLAVPKIGERRKMDGGISVYLITRCSASAGVDL